MQIRSAHDFLEQLSAYGDELRRQIELECEAFSADPQKSKKRRERAEQDYEYFCATYFPHYVRTSHRSSFQKDVFKRLPNAVDENRDARLVYMAPRGEAKSTYVTQLGVLWCVCTERKHFTVILMDSAEQAMEMLEAIKAELDTNPRLKLDFPDASGSGRVWQSATIVTNNNIKIRAGGSGKRIRGMRHGPYRPDFVVIDDLENDENVRQKAQRDKTESWILNAVLNLGPPDGGMDVVYVGTSLHYDAAINRIAKNAGWESHIFKAIEQWPDDLSAWENWENILKIEGKEAAERYYRSHQTTMDAGAVVSWSEVRPLYRLMEIRAANHDAFEREYQNTPGNDAGAPFKNIQFWVDRLSEWMFFGACDPSLGKSNKSRDPSALLVGGYQREKGVLDVVEADIRRLVPDLMIARLIELQREYRCVAWAFETVQFQEFLYTETLKRSMAAGVAFPGVSIKPTTDKDLRILGIQPHVSNGFIRLHRTQTTLIEQLQHYPEADHDDGPDALEMLWRIAQTYSVEYAYESVGSARGSGLSSHYAGDNTTDGWDD